MRTKQWSDGLIKKKQRWHQFKESYFPYLFPFIAILSLIIMSPSHRWLWTAPKYHHTVSKRHYLKQGEKVSLHTFLATSTKMLLLKPSRVVTIHLSMILVGSVGSVMTKRKVFGIGLYCVPVHLLFCCSFI